MCKQAISMISLVVSKKCLSSFLPQTEDMPVGKNNNQEEDLAATSAKPSISKTHINFINLCLT